MEAAECLRVIGYGLSSTATPAGCIDDESKRGPSHDRNRFRASHRKDITNEE